MGLSFPEIDKLSVIEKIQLAEKLWESVEKERALPLTEAQDSLLKKRLALHEANPAAGKNWDVVKQKYQRQ